MKIHDERKQRFTEFDISNDSMMITQYFVDRKLLKIKNKIFTT